MINSKDLQLLAEESFADPAFFMRTFLPQWFYLPMPWVHRGMLAILSRQTDWLLKFGEEHWPRTKGIWDEPQLEKIIRHFVWKADPDDPLCPPTSLFKVDRDRAGRPCALHLSVSDRMLFMMPRGISKTTLVNGHNLREIARHESPFIFYLSESSSHSEMQLGNIKRELETNNLFINVFGQKKPERLDPEKWTSKFIQTTDGIAVAAKGRGGQVRGQNVDGKRPSDIILDDVEDKESTKTEEQREKAFDWYKSDVEQALPQIGENRGRIILLGTLLHPESMLARLSKTPEFISVVFGSKDSDGLMLWDHYMTEKQYEDKRSSFARVRKLGLFNLEFNSTVKQDEEDAVFPERFIQYSPIGLEAFKQLPGRAIVIDPAISEKKDSDFTAIAVVGMSPRGQIHIAHVHLERGMHPRAQVDKYFELHFLYDCNRHGVETVAYQKALKHLLTEEMFRRGKTFGHRAYFEVEDIAHGHISKDDRITGILGPRYAAGYITHERIFADYESQLIDFPAGKKDGPDAVAMAVALLDGYAAYAFDPGNEDPDRLAKDVYAPIDDEIEGWRQCP